MKQHIGGLQLAIFEVVWPAYPWIARIRLLDEPLAQTLYVQAESTQDARELEACTNSLREVLTQWKPDVVVFVRHQPPSDSEHSIEVMSSEIFKQIASDVAPWRLAIGR